MVKDLPGAQSDVEITWPNRWFADPLIISVLLLGTMVIGVVFLVLRSDDPVWTVAWLVPSTLFLGILLLVAGLWISQAINTTITTTAKGLILRNVAGERIDIHWDHIRSVFWREEAATAARVLQLEYTDESGSRRQLRIRPRAPRHIPKVRRLRDFIIKRSQLQEANRDGHSWINQNQQDA